MRARGQDLTTAEVRGLVRPGRYLNADPARPALSYPWSAPARIVVRDLAVYVAICVPVVITWNAAVNRSCHGTGEVGPPRWPA